jgi:inorganic pyrophosphatase/exopolyphosphatase
LNEKEITLSTEKKLAAINKMFKRAVTPVTVQKGVFDPRKTTSYQDNTLDIMLAKTHAQGAAWHRAMEQAQDEFRKEGITDLSYQNKDLIKRADELYASGEFSDVEQEVYQQKLEEQKFERREWGETGPARQRKRRFDPRTPKTYCNASSNQLLID